MKILFLLLTFSLQNPFEKVDQMVNDKKFSSAVQELNRIDPKNENPEAYRRKVEICVDNYIISIGHQLFGIRNLESNEDVKSLRGQEGNYEMFSLDVTTIGKRLLETFPNDYRLKFAIGKYFHSMHLNCRDCSFSPSDCINEFERLFSECYDHGVYDYLSAFGIAYAKIMKQEYSVSIPYFLKSIELKGDYASSHYNLSYAYLYLDDRENSIKYAINALSLYDYPAYKADAAKLVGTAYRELQEFEKAYNYYSLANSIYPNDYYTLNPLLNLGLYLKKDSTEITRNNLFKLDNDNPTIYDNLIFAYQDYGSINDLITFFEEQKKSHMKEPVVLGNLDFYLGKINLQQGNVNEGKVQMIAARTNFEKVYGKDHKVFEVIEQILSQN